MHALAQAFDWLAHVIAADWSSPEREIRHGDTCVQVVHQRLCTPTDIWGFFIDCAAERFGIQGSIRPEFTPDSPRMFGAWSF